MYKKIKSFWQRRSLRFWLMTGLLMTIIPFVVFSVSTYSYINNRVITPFSSLITKQQQVLVPINKLQVSVWGISTSVADFFC
jgi:hypothetical protein